MIKRIYDFYLRFPIFIDIIISILVWIIGKYYPLYYFILEDRNNQISILGNLISTNISLAGFTLAALTIIITFKANVDLKKDIQPSNALELIFSSKHYQNIVTVYKKSLIEFILCFIIISGAWLFSDTLSINTVFRFNLTGVLLTILAICRSLAVLFIILNLENHKKQ